MKIGFIGAGNMGSAIIKGLIRSESLSEVEINIFDVDVKKSIEQELMEDIMSLMASFSGKLYGMRSKKNKITEKKGKIDGNKGNKKIVTEHLKELRTVDELEDLIGKEKLAQFFVEHYLEKVKEDLPEPDFDIEDIMK